MPECAFQDLKHPRTFRLVEHWRGLASGRQMPYRSEFDPVEIPSLLPSVILVDRADNEYRFRVAGTEVVDMFGYELTRKTFSQVYGGGARVGTGKLFPRTRDALGYWNTVFDRVFRTQQCLYGRDSLFWQGRDYRTFDWALLPLAANDGSVRETLAAVVFD